MKRKLLVLTSTLLLFACGAAWGQAAGLSPAEQLGWQMAIHERTFEKFTLYQAMDKTAALGLNYFSFSARVKLDDNTNVATANLTDDQIADIKKHLRANNVPLPGNEANCRKEFEFAKKMGIGVLVGEPTTDALNTVEKLCKEYNIKVAIHDHPKASHSLYWNPEAVLAAIKDRGPLMGACADTGHWMRSGLDPVQCLKTLQGRVGRDKPQKPRCPLGHRRGQLQRHDGRVTAPGFSWRVLRGIRISL
jgi:sugar phosphate isomerase/epimerase